MKTLFFVGLVVLAFLADVVVNTEWTNCAKVKDDCRVPGSHGIREVRMGYDNMWGYIGAYNQDLPCLAHSFGDAAPDDYSKQTCLYSNTGQEIDDKDWTWCAPADEHYDCNVHGTGPDVPVSIRFGDNKSNTYTYHQATESFPCQSQAFGHDPDPGVQKYCWTAVQPPQWTNKTKWVSCATENQECDLPIADAVYQVKMVAEGSDMGQVRAFSGPKIDCNTWNDNSNHASFQDWVSGKKTCYHSYYPISQIKNTNGRWNPAISCGSKASCTHTLSIGVDSTSQSSKSEEWSKSVTNSFSENTDFLSKTLSTTVSTSVINTYSSSLTESVTVSCMASCDEAEDGQEVTLYQWLYDSYEINFFQSNQVQGSDLYYTFTYFVCSYKCVYYDTGKKIAPQCPPNYCKDENCQECTQDIYAHDDSAEEKQAPNPIVSATKTKHQQID